MVKYNVNARRGIYYQMSKDGKFLTADELLKELRRLEDIEKKYGALYYANLNKQAEAPAC